MMISIQIDGYYNIQHQATWPVWLEYIQTRKCGAKKCFSSLLHPGPGTQLAASFNFSTKNNRQDGSGTPQRKTSYHRLAFGARTGSQGPPTPHDDDDEDDDGPELGLDQLEISDVGPELNKVNSTFEKRGSSRTNLTYDNCDEPSNLLNGTFDKVTKYIL